MPAQIITVSHSSSLHWLVAFPAPHTRVLNMHNPTLTNDCDCVQCGGAASAARSFGCHRHPKAMRHKYTPRTPSGLLGRPNQEVRKSGVHEKNLPCNMSTLDARRGSLQSHSPSTDSGALPPAI